MSNDHNQPGQAPPPGLTDLVARYVEALEAHGPVRADALLAEQPELADAARAQLARLRQAGLLTTGGAAGAPPPEVAHYAILERIGAGGMGEVYLAEQRVPVRRRVALKVIKLGMTSRDVLARFDVERQALAMMSHPNIARVLDVGSTAQGQPYFAMEYVPGLPIATYCDQRRLSTSERVQLMLGVCDAVQHAHYKGIIHRDLKPTNVLVAEQDGRPTPKIIDFGVAKAVAVGIGSGTVYTAHGMVVGTPEYMSPEQAGRGELDVDTRTDVYSIGVMLYELLAGSLPFPTERLRAGGLEQMLSIIRDEAPPRPSTRVSGKTPGTERLATARSTDLGSLRQHLRGDLDWIVLKALEKDRNRRYQTPALLAEDLRRCLNNEAVTARPPSLTYRFAKFVRRNRLSVALASVTLIVLCAGLVVSLLFYRRAEVNSARAELARGEADAARAVAERNFDSALQAVDDLLSRVGDSSLAHIPHMEAARRDLLNRALRFYEGFAAQRSLDAKLRLELATALDRVGRIESLLGDSRAAVAKHRAALEAFDVLLAAEPDNLRVAERRAGTQAHLAHALQQTGEPGARELLDAAMASLETLRTREVPSRLQRQLYAEVSLLLAEVLATDDVGAAVGRARPALAEFEALVAAEPDDIGIAARAVLARFGVAQFEMRRREWRVALDLLTRADAEATALLARAPERVDLRRARCLAQEMLAVVLDDLGQSAEAETAVRESIARWRDLAQAFPLAPDFRGSLAHALSNGAETLGPSGQGDFEPMNREAVTLYTELVRAAPTNVAYRRGLIFALLSGGMRKAGSANVDEVGEGLVVLQRAREAAVALATDQPDNGDCLRLAVQVNSMIGSVHQRRRERELARQSFAAATVAAAALVKRSPGSIEAAETYATALINLAKLDAQTGDMRAAAESTDLAIGQLRPAAQRDARRGGVRRLLVDSLSVRGLAAVALEDVATGRACYAELRALAQQPDELLLAAGVAAAAAQSTAAAADPGWFKTETLAALRAAVAAGYKERARLAADSRFAALRDDPEFAAILGSLPDK